MREGSRNPRTWLRAVWLRPIVGLWAGVLIATWLVAQIGVTGAIDAVARREFYAERGTRAGGASVLLIAIDHDTVRDWGPPPWPWTRYQALIDPILAGGPRLIAVLEPGPRVLPDANVPAELAAAVTAGRLVLPPAEAGFRQPAVVLDKRGVVEAIDLGDPSSISGRSMTADVVRRLGFDRTGQLPVNFIGSVDTLPTLLAHQVARGDVPPETFARRIIVIGLKGDRFTNLVPTPVGPMAPAEIHAHALHALIEGAIWREPGVLVRCLLVAVIAALGLAGPRRARTARRAVVLVAIVAAVIVAGSFVAFAWFHLALDLGAPVIALALAVLAGLLLERQEAQGGVAELRDHVAHRLRHTAASRPGVSQAVIHERFAEALRTHIKLQSCLWAELPPGTWHVVLQHWHGCAEAQVLEQRRDVRRDPWRLPFGSHRPEWTNRPFMSEELDLTTLLVPVAAFGRLFGFWIVNVRDGTPVTDEQLRQIEALSDDVALALEEYRQQGRSMVERDQDHLPSALVDAVRTVRHDALMMGHLHGRSRAVLDRLPVGVLIATTWGYVEHCNLAMQRFLAAAGVDAPERLGVAVLLARVTGVEVAAVHDVLRELATSGHALRLETRITSASAPPQIYELVLTQAQLSDGAADEQGRSSLMLTATARDERPLVALDWRWSGLGAGSRNVVDVAQLVAQTLRELQEAGVWPVAPVVSVRTTSAIAVVTRGEDVAEAVRAIAQLASGDAAGPSVKPRIGIEDGGDALTVRIDHATQALLQSDVAMLLSATLEDAPAHLAPLIRARLQIEANRGRVEITSDLARGTTFAIRLPKPGVP